MCYNLTPDDFKSYFSRGEFKYSPLWENNVEYKIGQIVWYGSNNYKAKGDNSAQEPDLHPEIWQMLPKNLYVLDSDIKKAFTQAKGNFNIRLFKKSEEDIGKMCFLLLTAHYLLQDWDMIAGNGGSAGVVTSKSVGSVSASYQIPEVYLRNPLYSYLTGTPYGLKYLSYICGRSVGNMAIVQGATNIF
jgi:hypothetical protein